MPKKPRKITRIGIAVIVAFGVLMLGVDTISVHPGIREKGMSALYSYIWMGLVAAGFVVQCFRIICGK